MKRLLILTGILLQFLIIQGQVNTDFSKGFIIQNNNDTTFGELKLTPYSYMSSKVQFKGRTNGSGLLSFKPNDLIGFYIQPNTYFESIRIKSLKGKDTINLNYFALKIISGEIDFLIVYLPHGSEKYFVRSKVLGLTELEQLIETRENQKLTKNKYIFTLAKYMNNNPKFQTRIRNCGFHQKSIINLISDYNSDFGANILTQPSNKLNWSILINAGMDYYLGNRIIVKHNAWGMVLGFQTSIYNKKKNLKTELIIGLNYRRYQETIRYGYGGHLIEVPIYLKYNNKMRLFSPIIEAGVKPYFIQKKAELVNSISIKTNVIFTYEKIIGLGIGLNFKNLNIKYVIYAQPILQNSICIGYKLK